MKWWSLYFAWLGKYISHRAVKGCETMHNIVWCTKCLFYLFMIYFILIALYPTCWYRSIASYINYHYVYSLSPIYVYFLNTRVHILRSRNCGCLVWSGETGQLGGRACVYMCMDVRVQRRVCIYLPNITKLRILFIDSTIWNWIASQLRTKR